MNYNLIKRIRKRLCNTICGPKRNPIHVRMETYKEALERSAYYAEQQERDAYEIEQEALMQAAKEFEEYSAEYWANFVDPYPDPEVEMVRYVTREEAAKGHEELCRKYGVEMVPGRQPKDSRGSVVAYALGENWDINDEYSISTIRLFDAELMPDDTYTGKYETLVRYVW